MTPQEFKAWFEGFSEGIAERPTAKQWQRICKRVKEVDGTPIRYVEYVRQYWPYWTTLTTTPPQWRPWEVICNTQAGGAATLGNLAQGGGSPVTVSGSGSNLKIGSERDAMRGLPTLQDIGRAEFAEVAHG